MSTKRNHRPRTFLTGGISLVLILFAILCLISFATLSLSSARADARLTDKYAAQETSYISARNDVQRWLQDIDTAFADAYQETPAKAAYQRAVKSYCKDLNVQLTEVLSEVSSVGPTGDESDHENTLFLVTRSFPMNERQELHVTVRVLYPENENGPFLEVASMQAVTLTSHEYDESLHVITDQ